MLKNIAVLYNLKKVSFYSTFALAAALTLTSLISIVPQANAATLSQTSVRMDRIRISTQTTGTICAKPATASTEASLEVVFPTGYTLGAAGTFTVNTTNLAWPAGGTPWLGINTATNVTSQTVTFPSGELAVGTLYCFNWTNSAAVQTKSSATSSNSGTLTTKDAGTAIIDSASYSTVTIGDDQLGVTATVPQAFSFALSNNGDALGALSTASVATSPTPRTITINTNGKNGWGLWAKDVTTGLSSSAATYTIPSTTPGANATLSAGTEGYNLGVTGTQTAGSGTLSIAAGYIGTGAGQGGGLDTSLRTLVSSNGTASNAVLTLKNNAAVSSLTPAAQDYSDTITFTAAGLF